MPVIPYSYRKGNLKTEKNSKCIEKNQVASLGDYTTNLKQLCLTVKGHAGFSIANVLSTAFVTELASVSNYAHKSKAIVAAALYLRWSLLAKALCIFP